MNLSLILLKIKTKVYNLIQSKILFRFGYGSNVSKSIWEDQYSGTNWDFLYSDDEKEHYLAIINQIQAQKSTPNILDIGCGHGAMFNYFKNSTIDGLKYTGTDISEVAIKKAEEKFPDVPFKAINFDNEKIDGKFNIIILNEVLYYFSKPIKTLQKAIADNMEQGGILIISMYEDKHDINEFIWKSLEPHLETLNEQTVVNSKGTTWTVKTLAPKK